MNPSIQEKLEQLVERQEEINTLLSDPSVIAQHDSYRDLSIELSDISPVVTHFQEYQKLARELDQAKNMTNDDDLSIRKMALEELPRLQMQLDTLQDQFQKLLIPKDPNDDRNIFLEIRAGTGGDEAALFAGDLFRMYSNFGEKQRWKIEIMSQSLGEHGGFKEIISRMYNPKDVKVGDKIDFQIDPNKVHFFDAETEKAIF